jgi:hypothetical protein
MKKPEQLPLDQRRYALEATLTAKVKDWLDIQKDLYYWKASDRYTKGVSDIVVCVQGMFVGIELKKDGGVSSPHQKLFARQITSAGGIAGVAYTLGEVKDLVAKARSNALQ